jgi:hypothetical protein
MPHSRDRRIATLGLLADFAFAVEAKRLIERQATATRIEFWQYIIDQLFDRAAIQWCKVFGSKSDDTHWTNVVPARDHAEVRSVLLDALGVSRDEWRQYRDHLKSFRDQMAAHHDLEATVRTYPRFDIAMAAAEVMHGVVYELIDPGWRGGLSPAPLAIQTRRRIKRTGPVVARAVAATSAFALSPPAES